MNLIKSKPSRLFTFGCSFTRYAWSMWPEIIAYDLEIPLYNYGRTGAGNQFIANTITQANAKYKFNSNDLVIVCWTNVCREDRWVNGDWILPGNMFSQNEYDSKWVEKYVDPLGLLIRDLSTINLIDSFLKTSSCQYHFLSMMNIVNDVDQWDPLSSKIGTLKRLNPETGRDFDILDELIFYYDNSVKKINKSFYEILWNNEIDKKLDFEIKRFNGSFQDGHPWPEESLKYLTSIFDSHKFKNNTLSRTIDISNKIINEILNYTLTNKIKHKPLPVWGIKEKTFDKIIFDYAILKNNLPLIL
jgi:hypothetical protein